MLAPAVFGRQVAPTRLIVPASASRARRAITSGSASPSVRPTAAKGRGTTGRSRCQPSSSARSSGSSRARMAQSPVRCARAVKKMPDGLSAGISASFSKLLVS